MNSQSLEVHPGSGGVELSQPLKVIKSIDLGVVLPSLASSIDLGAVLPSLASSIDLEVVRSCLESLISRFLEVLLSDP